MSTQTVPRAFKDAQLVRTKALPAAAAANFSDSIDLQVPNVGANLDNMEFVVSIPATPSLANTKTVTLTLKDSADDTTFAAIPGVNTLVVTGAGGVGAAAASVSVKLPPAARRYIRLDAAVEADGGSNIAVSYSLTPVF